MNIIYFLINKTKKEMISYMHLTVNSDRELTGNPVAAAITTWYMLKNIGDDIGFIPAKCGERRHDFGYVSWEEVLSYNDRTDNIINELIENKILIDKGIEIFDTKSPEVYIRILEVTDKRINKGLN